MSKDFRGASGQEQS